MRPNGFLDESYFVFIDLLNGYWRLQGRNERIQERSAFCTRRGLFHSTQTPFGLSAEFVQKNCSERKIT